MHEPLISIIVPVYNVQNYIEKCLDSLINQTYKNIEIICVDDCSEDNSLEIIKSYINKDKRIILAKHNENKGLASARNTGLSYAKGEYISFLDSDDYVENNLYEIAANIFNNFDIDFYCFSSKPFVEGEIIQDYEGMKEYIKVKRDGLFDVNFDIALDTNIHVWNKIYKHELIKKYNLRFIDGLLYEDIFFSWAYNFISAKAYYESECLHHYRIHSNSIMEKCTKNKEYEKTIDHLNNWHKLFEFCSEHNDIFDRNYNNLSHLLEGYRYRTKELCPVESKYKIEKIYLEYKKELEQEFKIKYPTHKVLNIMGIKLKIRRKN